MTRTRLQLTFAGADASALSRLAFAADVLPSSSPTSLMVDGAQVDPATPLLALLATRELTAMWGQTAMLRVSPKRDNMFVDRGAWDVTAETTVALIRDWPFEVCTTNRIDPSWWTDYRSIHGWAFILKGRGHRLVSPRIIDRGPWRRVRDASRDVTLFQFHDLDDDAATALEQARPGHALLAPVWQAGHYAGQLWAFRGSAHEYRPTFYDPATRASVVLVQDTEVSATEMAIASATRVHQVFPQPVEQVAFTYMTEATARQQLPALWLYGLEVRAMTAEGERRIDPDYQPPALPEPPGWVKRLGGSS